MRIKVSNNSLPVANFRDEIVKTINQEQVVIITAETGAGKSTQVPQYLLDAGYNIVVTQPRRLAARTVAARVAQEYRCSLGGIIGFRTAYERKDSAETRCLFITDGLALVRELVGVGDHQILVIDEVHEWNLNIEVLVAWAKRRMQEVADFKLVLMSATLEAEKLSRYFGGAPIISLPGRQYEVVEQKPGTNLESDVAELLRKGRNVLVFRPGKAQIAKTIDILSLNQGINAEILPLHGELSSDQQAKCFETYSRPKCVVATKIAQTSVTIPDIDAVVDDGQERRIELVDGVEGLYLLPISQADAEQRKGRAGRTKPGLYIDWCTESWDRRPKFPKAEILRSLLDQTVLRLAESGFDAETLEFFHQPDNEAIKDAHKVLVALGCIDQYGAVTKIGHTVAKLPVSVQYARMIVEGDRLGVVDDIITIAAILEQGEINARVCSKCRQFNQKSCECWKKAIARETVSDVLAQLSLFEAAKDMTRDQLNESGIFPKAFYQAKEKRSHLVRSLKGKVQEGSTGNRENILKAISAGMMHNLFQRSYGSDYMKQGLPLPRGLNRDSVVKGSPEWIVGAPWDLQFKNRYGDDVVLKLIKMASAINPEWLVEIAPHLSELREGLFPAYDPEYDEVVSTTHLVFNGSVVKQFLVLDPQHEEASRLRLQGRNEKQWTDWIHPEMPLPNVNDSTATVADIITCTYGEDVETGEALVAYGTITRSNHYFSSDVWFRAFWSRDLDEVQLAHQQAIASLEELQYRSAAEAERLLVQQLKIEADPLMRQLVSNTRNLTSTRSVFVHQDRFYGLYSVKGVQDWRAEAERLILVQDEERKVLDRLRAKAFALRNEVNKILREDGSTLSDKLYSDVEYYDCEDFNIPETASAIQDWMEEAARLLDEARKVVRDSRNNEIDLSALAGRFNSR